MIRRVQWWCFQALKRPIQEVRDFENFLMFWASLINNSVFFTRSSQNYFEKSGVWENIIQNSKKIEKHVSRLSIVPASESTYTQSYGQFFEFGKKKRVKIDDKANLRKNKPIPYWSQLDVLT